MPNTKLLIFGNPKGGTPLMLVAPSIAIDLPLKILIAEDAQAKVWVSYNRPQYLKERHGVPENLLANIAVVETRQPKLLNNRHSTFCGLRDRPTKSRVNRGKNE